AVLILLEDNNLNLMPRTVLLIEDSEAEAQMLERGLRASVARGSIVIVSNTSEAEHYLFDEGLTLNLARPAPDLVVLDLSVSTGGGLEFIKRVRANARTRAIPVLMISDEMGDQE